MAGNRAAPPRARSANPEARREQLIVLAALAVLVVAIVVVLVGLYFTVYLPPRVHVLTVGSKSYDAAAVEHRALYLLFNEPSLAPSGEGEIVSTTLDTLEREGILRERGASAVAEVKPEDITAELQQELVPPPPPEATPVATGTPSGTPTATATPTATPTVDQAAYTKALQQRLERSKMTKAELDPIIAAKVYQDRLLAKFKADVPKTLPEIQVVVARLADQATADRVRAVALRPGVDFSPVAAQNSVSTTTGVQAGVPDWVIVDQLDPVMRDAVKDLKPGDVSAVTKNGAYFEVYKVIDTSANHDVTDAQRNQIANGKLTDWIKAERPNVKIQRDLTPTKEDWILKHTLGDYQKASATAATSGG